MKFNLKVNGKTTEKMTEKAVIKKLALRSNGNFFASEVSEMIQDAIRDGSCRFIKESDRRYDVTITVVG